MAVLAQYIVAVISHLGYGGVVLLMAIESACIPLPSEVTLPFSGYLVATGRFRLLPVALAGAIGCNLGSIVGYAIGFYGGRPVALRYGRWVGFGAADLDRAEAWVRRNGNASLFVGRLLPIVRTFIALPAGITRMRAWPFHLYTFLGSLIWCWVLAFFGMRLGQHWTQIEPYFRRFNVFWSVALAALIVVALWHHARAWRVPARQIPGASDS